MELLALLNS